MTSPATRSYRRDIDGLRGLAIALVVVFHVFVGRVSSGVDVFLLIGGVFFFGPQIRNALNPAGQTFPQSVIRLLRRLYPALLTVVTITLLLGMAVYSRTRWAQMGEDAAASLTYRQNLHLADLGQDYSAIGRGVSLYQHIWSMSAQLQIYLGSLLVIVVLGWLLRRAPRRVATATLQGLLVAATIASFWYAVYLHDADQGWNYYSPLSRFWEIGLGGLLGFWLVHREIPARLSAVRWPVGVLGVTLIVGTGFFLNGAEQFPGPWTLVPLLGAALVVLSGNPVRASRGVAATPAATSVKDAATRAEGAVVDAAAPSAASANGAGADGPPTGADGPPTGADGPPTGAGGHTQKDAPAHTPSPVGIAALFSTRPFRVLGRIAYSLYLWHWPLLVLATFYFSSAVSNRSTGVQGITATLGPRRGLIVGFGVIILSLVLAWLTERFVETPLRQATKPAHAWWPTLETTKAALRNIPGIGVAVVTVAATVGVLAFAPVVHQQDNDRLAALDSEDLDPVQYPGPRAFLDNAAVPEGVPVRPDPANEEHMLPQSQIDGCYARFQDADLVTTHDFNASAVPCEYGDVNSTRTVYLAGGSHSEHFLPALDAVARRQHIKVVPVLKMGCVLGMALPKLGGEDYPECAEWDAKAQEFIFNNPPTDGVFMTVTRPTTIEGDGPDQIPQDYVTMVRKFSDAGIHTWGVRDTPWNMQAPGEQGNGRLCVAEGLGTGPTADCGTDQFAALAPVNPALVALAGLDVTEIDLTAALCRDGRCPAVVGNVLVYRDGQHFSDVYARLLAPELERQMFDPAALAQMEAAKREAIAAAGTPGGGVPDTPAHKDVFRVPKPEEWEQ